MSFFPIRILLVEDNPTDVQLIKRQIVKVEKTAEISVASDLSKVEAELENFKPHIIISDYRLPTCSGLNVLELSERMSHGTPFIFLTGAIHDEELAANTILSGASGYYLKKNINTFHEKLTPFVNAIKNNSPLTSRTKDRITESRQTIKNMEEFLEKFNSTNLSHIEGINKIREDLAKLREQNDF